MDNNQSQEGNFVAGLSGLRGIAAFEVALFHSAQLFQFNAWPKLLNGQAGVALFFSLSGFLMGHLYLNKPCSGANVQQYLLARVGRIVPLYTIGTILVRRRSLWRGIRLCFTNGNSVHCYLSEINSLLSELLYPRSHLWTVPPELQFYVAFIFVWAVSSWRLLASAIALITFSWYAVAFIQLMAHDTNWLFQGDWHEGTLLEFLPIFALSSLLGGRGFAHARVFCGERLINFIGPLLLVAWVINSVVDKYRFFCNFLVLPLRNAQTKWWFLSYYDAWHVLVNISLPPIVFAQPTTLAFLASGPMVWLGTISFGVYVYHVFVFEACKMLIPHTWQPYVGFAWGFGATLVLAHVSYNYLEKPLSLWFRGLRRVKRQQLL